ncbi:transglutaminase-like domain-containing protein [Chryseobacterium oryzae]|uniref:Transglutaminase-like domain-containing protein n=1 Tax=Chryseobacterium oryzae TaxID=2929799 RepID=A0ABY4BE56_9FLAO|nr:transglutaminase-like domain-containing protein [Chryseobacterium oryzae]UOE37179.1 transglutaminase-like domain-containing protein [Chryseobacterium oryzae]
MRNIIMLFAVFCMSTALFAQEQKFLKMPKFNKDDLKKEKSEIEPKAPAEILYRSIHFRIDSNSGNLIKEYTYRVKIYDKDKSEDWHNLEVSLYDNNSGDREVLMNMNALVYNLEGDNIVETKVDKSSKFRSKENKYRTVNKYAFPAIKNGSILEYHYEVSSPFIYEIPLIYIELDTPSVYTEYVLDSPIQVSYSVDFTGELFPKYKIINEAIMYGSHYKTYRFGYDNLKSFKTEKFVKNNDNYRTKIRAELHSTYIRNNIKMYTTTWEDIRRELWDAEFFGSQYKKDRLVKELITPEILGDKDDLSKANKILEYVKTNFTWNQNNGIYAENGVRDLIKNKTGNDSDINLMLTAMFRSANITAYPILISTVSNGSVNLTLPNLGNFNYVIVGVEINKEFYLFDATSKQSKANLLPLRVWNDNGLILKDNKAEIISINNTNISYSNYKLKAKINSDGTISGEYQDQDEGMLAMNAKERFDENPDKYKKQYKNNFSVDFTNINSRALNGVEFRSTMAFTSNNMIDVIGKKMILNPLLFLHQTKNDFDQQDERKYRIDFISPMSKIKMVEIEIPEGYEVAELPKNKKILTEDKEISYSYTVEKKDNKILTFSEYNIASGNYPKEYYPAFKQIWKVISDCESQVMSLIKK